MLKPSRNPLPQLITYLPSDLIKRFVTDLAKYRAAFSPRSSALLLPLPLRDYFFYMPMGRVTHAAARDVKAMISAELTLPTLLISA